MSNGKGSKRRPRSSKIKPETFEENWDKVFNKKETNKNNEQNDTYDIVPTLQQKSY